MPLGSNLSKRISVDSSELLWIQFDPPSSTLRVEFVSGGIYEYSQVPRAKFEALLAAASKGTYFNANIRGRHAYTRIE